MYEIKSTSLLPVPVGRPWTPRPGDIPEVRTAIRPFSPPIPIRGFGYPDAPCPDGMHRQGSYPYDCVSNTAPTGVLIFFGALFAGALALGFYQASKGISPVYERRPVVVYTNNTKRRARRRRRRAVASCVCRSRRPRTSR